MAGAVASWRTADHDPGMVVRRRSGRPASSKGLEPDPIKSFSSRCGRIIARSAGFRWRGGWDLAQNSIFSLLYVSTATASAAMSLRETMQDILVASHVNNRRDGITGFLLADGYVFVQLLEGPELEVQACFSRICADGRNWRPRIRDIGRGRERLFPDWAMCGLNLAGRDNMLLRPGVIGFDLLGASAGALRQHLQSLVLRHGTELQRAHAPLLAPDY